MKKIWKDPQIVTGPPAIGNSYYTRPSIEEYIWAEIEKGSHVLLAAPRRVGKTSVMKALEDRAPGNVRCLFKNIQGIKSEREFYKMFFDALVSCLDKFKRGAGWLQGLLGGITVEEITLEGVKFGSKKEINYVEEIDSLLPKVADQDIKVVLLLDELPEVLNNLHKNDKEEEAGNILNRLRQWRQHPEIHQHLSTVLAGSVGLHHIVKTIEGRTADINDLVIVPFEALNRQEANAYIDWATQEATVQYDDGLRTYLLDKIGYFVPYYLNLMLDKINQKARQANTLEVTIAEIDDAFDLIVKDNLAFRDWNDRIGEYFSKERAEFLYEVLTFVAHKEKVTIKQLYNLAKKHNLQRDFMQLVTGLERDGYLVETEERSYRFISPFLKASWLRNYPVYE